MDKIETLKAQLEGGTMTTTLDWSAYRYVASDNQRDRIEARPNLSPHTLHYVGQVTGTDFKDALRRCIAGSEYVSPRPLTPGRYVGIPVGASAVLEHQAVVDEAVT